MNPDKTEGGDVRPASILIVDDTPANLQLLVGVLEGRGYKVRPVPSGKLALLAARRDPPDLILLDINMPEMNGYEVCEQLKADDKLKGIPVIFISGLTEQLDKVKAFAIGGVDYLTKPFQVEEMLARVETHLKLRRLQIELEELNARLAMADRRKNEFLAMLAHELRNPLAPIRNAAQILRMTEGTGEAVRSASAMMERQVGQMVRLVDDLLDVSRISRGKIELRRERIELDSAREQCPRQECGERCDGPPAVQVLAEEDRDRDDEREAREQQRRPHRPRSEVTRMTHADRLRAGVTSDIRPWYDPSSDHGPGRCAGKNESTAHNSVP